MSDEINVDKILKELVKRGIDVKGGIYTSVVTIILGLLTKIDTARFNKNVDNLLNSYNKTATWTASLALTFSIVCLIDSLQDNQKIRNIYVPQLVNALGYKDEQQRLQRLGEIKTSLEADRQRQVTMFFLKVLATLTFGFLAWNTVGNSTARYMMGAAAGISGSAALLNGYNYSRFNTLIKQLEKDKLIS